MRADGRWIVLSLVLGACGEPSAPAPAPAPPPPPPPAPIVAARPITSRASFDLVALPDGAALAWGATANDGGGVRAIALDPLGGARGLEVVVAGEAVDGDPGAVEELAVAAAGQRVAVAWIARSGAALRARATIASAGVDAFAPVRELGATVPGAHDRSTRGRVAAWGRDDGSATVVHRAPPGPCQSSAGVCARFSMASVGDGEGTGGRDVIVNEVREPCDPLVVGGLARGTAFFYGACHASADGGPTTTLYAIDRGGGGALASAPDVIGGCVPIGIAPGATGAIAVGRCEDGVAAQEVGPRGDLLGAARPAERSARCESGRPVLALSGVRVPLVEAVSRIEALLPESIAPAGARAVWTGEAILVAAPSGREVAVRRYQCARDPGVDAITRTDVP